MKIYENLSEMNLTASSAGWAEQLAASTTGAFACTVDQAVL